MLNSNFFWCACKARIWIIRIKELNPDPSPKAQQLIFKPQHRLSASVAGYEVRGTGLDPAPAPDSGSFYYQAKIVRNTLIPNVFRLLYEFLSLKNDVNVAPKSEKQKNFSCHLPS
jgi:hypothetical protein